ncbi:hypothetical protein PR202_ga23396 [Eleusine coracana subsp. coracana]|uniref:arginine--tRNA ligase n=1 Tax=Eleusine coracana subsp. coracana TaxID=191504 RepID=A0AAV5D5Q8_ELECO|nr:hypothetical protein PR202_ga23396 [Eleusine coracana subsp. coracana]
MQHQAPEAAEHVVKSVRQQLCKLIASSLSATIPGVDVELMLEVSKPGFGDYQCCLAVLSFKQKLLYFQEIANNLPPSDIVQSTSVAGPGYVNIVIASDWIAEFGMLIEFLFEKFPNWEEVGNQAVGDLQSFYKASKTKFDEDEEFKGRAQKAVVRLQEGQERYRAAWKKICEISRNEFDLVYKRLGVELEEKAASMAGWLPDQNEKRYPKTSHVGFGLVLGPDGKRFRTRACEVVRLVDLLDEAQSRCKAELEKRLTENGKIADWTDGEIDNTSKIIGLGAVKYADLKNNRLTDYTFSFEKMLSDKGNTAVYLQYAHARICSIIRKAGKDIEKLKTRGSIACIHSDERALGLHLIRFQEVVEQACADLFPHYLCDYLYSLSEAFSKFYTNCPVIGSPEETSRLLLCEATAVVMRQCFYILGITPVYKL